MGQTRALFVYFRYFQTIFKIKTVDFSRIRTRIVEVEGEHGDHLTTTTAQSKQVFKTYLASVRFLGFQCFTECFDYSVEARRYGT